MDPATGTRAGVLPGEPSAPAEEKPKEDPAISQRLGDSAESTRTSLAEEAPTCVIVAPPPLPEEVPTAAGQVALPVRLFDRVMTDSGVIGYVRV